MDASDGCSGEVGSVELASKEVRRVSIPLTQLPRGTRGTVNPDNLDNADFATLRAMGLRPNATVEVCRLGQHCIVALTGACGGGCRIGIAKDLADKVMVQPATHPRSTSAS